MRIVLIGFGSVGRALATMLEERRDELYRRMGLSPRVPDVLSRHVGDVVDELLTGAGLTVEEIAEVMEISTATVKREWATAKLWLRREMQGL